MWNCLAVYYSSYTILHSYQQCIGVSVSQHSHQHLLFLGVVVVLNAILMNVNYLIVVFICIFLVMLSIFSCARWPFGYLLWRNLFKPFAHFLIKMVWFFLLSQFCLLLSFKSPLWATSLSLFTFMHWRRKWQPTPVFLPGESQGWGHTELDTTEVT